MINILWFVLRENGVNVSCIYQILFTEILTNNNDITSNMINNLDYSKIVNFTYTLNKYIYSDGTY